MQKLSWPIFPDHITKDAKYLSSEGAESLSGTGIITNEYLRGILTQIASRLRNPNTVLEFPPDPNKLPVRTDSISIHFDMHPPCRKFREGTNNCFCKECDIIHANLLRNLPRKDFRTQLEKSICGNAYKDQFRKLFGIESDITINSFERNPFLQYTCPHLGYQELVFPLFFEGKVIAAFFLGQLLVENQIHKIKKVQQNFFERNPDCFHNYNETNMKSISVDEIYAIDNKWRNDKENILSVDRYNELVSRTFDSLINLKSQLKHEMEFIRNHFLTERINHYIQATRKDISEIIPNDHAPLIPFWNKIQGALQKVKDDFQCHHIAIFARNKFTMDDTENLELVASAGLAKNVRHYYSFNLLKLGNIVSDRVVTSVENNKLLRGLESKFEIDPESDFIRIFPSPIVKYPIFVIWIRHNNTKWPRILQPETANEEFNSTVNSFWTFISLIYTSLWANRSSRILENALRVLAHEIGQITVGLEAIREQYLDFPKYLKMQSDTKLSLVNSDMEGLLSQIHYITEGTKHIVTNLPKVNLEYLYIHEIYTKWIHTYRLETTNKKIKLIALTKPSHDPSKPPLNADKMLFQQLLYNLISNAIKYCYQGTIIYLDYFKEIIDDEKFMTVSIQDYGLHFDSDLDQFQLYQRGKNVKGIEGLGVGLHMANKIAQAHNAKIAVSCRKISNYNIPLLHGAVQLQNDTIMKIENWKISQFKDEILQLKNLQLYDKVIAKTGTETFVFNPQIHTILKFVGMPTWEVTISVRFRIGE